MATVKGTAKVDSFTVNASSVIVVTGKKSSTKKISKNGKNRIYGAAAKDTFTIKGGKLNYIYGDAGNDTITVTSKIGSGNRIYGDDAKNKVSGNDTFAINGGSKNYFYGGKGVDTFNVNAGTTNYIYGGAGNDVIVIGKNSTGTAIVKDFNVKSGNTDKLRVTGGTVKSVTLSGKNLIVKGGKSASVKLENAAGKTISLQDSRGSYTASKTTIRLGRDFKGTLDSTKFLSTVQTIDGSNAIKAVNITGNAQNNIIYAGFAGGTYKGGKGNDRFYSGYGDDLYVYESGDDTIYCYKSFGTDTVQLAGTTVKDIKRYGNDVYLYLTNDSTMTVKNLIASKMIFKDNNSGVLTIQVGTTDKDLLSGGPGNNLIYGDAGNDSILIGGDDASIIYGGAGDDTIFAGIGDDYLYGEEGNDSIYGNAGNDIIFGGSGNDILNGNAGNNIISGDDGDDTIYGGDDDDFLYGGFGNDELIGWAGADYLYGGPGNDKLSGGDGYATFIDTFAFDAKSTGNSVIKDYQVGYDVIEFNDNIGIKTSSVKYGDVILNLTNGGTITIQSCAGSQIIFSDGYGRTTTRKFS